MAQHSRRRLVRRALAARLATTVWQAGTAVTRRRKLSDEQVAWARRLYRLIRSMPTIGEAARGVGISRRLFERIGSGHEYKQREKKSPKNAPFLPLNDDADDATTRLPCMNAIEDSGKD